MKLIFILAFYAQFVTPGFAQNSGKISGTVTQNTQPAEGATVNLLRARDSATVKLSVSNKAGQFSFDAVAEGRYLVSVTAAGQQKAFSEVVEVTPQQQSIQLAEIRLTPLNKDLAGITVTAKKPLVEQRIDRTIVNVDASITNIGTSALEVLEKSPGVTVDSDGNVSLKGKQSVMVMVDGRPTQLSGTDLTNLLRTMSSNQLDQIEIMTNPPARYDAGSNAGIINIKTKKTVKAGLNGSASVAYGQGKYPKLNEGFNFNYREGKVNLFTNLSHNYQKSYSILTLDRNIFNNTTGSIENIFNQKATRVSSGSSYAAKTGIDFFVNPKTTIGAVVNLNWRGMLQNNPNVTNISNVSKVLQSITKATVDNDLSWNSLSTNLNFRRVLDKKGREITSDIDYVKHSSDNGLFMVNSYTSANGDPLRKADTLTGTLPQYINIYSGRVDYLHPLKKNARFEAGIKSSIVRTDNDANYDSIQYGRIIHDFSRSNHFVYEENINTAYVN
ncbi:MAG TPA: TonB-dependent receptor, partial [Flavisolibacter sp.]|nr:TonB-dependent receptor [Flavisolibacter sp.]